MITNLLQALTVFAFILFHQESIFLLYFVVLTYSFFNQFYVPAESASLPSVVAKKDLPKANGLFLMTQQFAIIFGFGLAGLLQNSLGFNGSLILCSFFLFMAFVSVSFLPKLKPKSKIPKSVSDLIASFFERIIEGYRFIKGKKTILYPLLLVLGVQIALSVIIVNLPVMATEVLRVQISLIGLYVVVPAGIGALMGSFIVPKLLAKGYRKKTVIEYGLILTSFSLLAMIYVFPSLTPLFILLVGIGFVAVNVPTMTFLQEQTPIDLRGRVFGNMWFLVTLATLFPVLFSGVITELFGIRSLITVLVLFIALAYYYLKTKGQNLIEENFKK